MTYQIDSDITRAKTIESRFYTDAHLFSLMRDQVLARTWQWVGDLSDVIQPQSLSPREVLPGCLDEPVLLARDKDGKLRCLSNVCTHRGNLLVKTSGQAKEIRCGYHSRRFDLNGKMVFMPEFNTVKDFPSAADDLSEIPFDQFAGLAFVSFDPIAPLTSFVGEILERVRWLPLDRMRFDPSLNRDYIIAAHWALYVENYLEGFHIPFVHADLNQIVEYDSYATQLYRYANVQLALTQEKDLSFDLPHQSPDHGRYVAAYYCWIFPNVMLNFYPWGLSLNVVQPQAIDRTRVLFRSYVWDRSKLSDGAGSALQQVEMEDEAIVEAVQRGVRSRFYRHGRYSPTREQGVHHFHRLLCEFISRE